MNQRLVESVAQTILAMSAEERQLLESMLQHANGSSPRKELVEEAKTLRVAEIAQNIRTFEDKYSTSPEQGLDERATDKKEPFSAFFELAQSLQIEGPPDWSSRLDEYLNEDAMSTHE